MKGEVVAQSQHCWGTREQGIEPCDEQATYPGVDMPLPLMYPPCDPERDKAVKKPR